MRKIIALSLVPIMMSAPGLAAPGVTTNSVNFRSGPGTQFSSLRTLPAGTAVDIGDCRGRGKLVRRYVEGRTGFVSGRYLQEKNEKEFGGLAAVLRNRQRPHDSLSAPIH